MAKASEFVGLTPSGVKRQLDTLERHLKTKLYSGNPQGIILNGEGQELYVKAQNLLALFDQTIADVKGVKQTLEGDLKIIITNNGAAWFSQHFQEFRELYPGINLKLIIDEKRSLLYSTTISGVTIGLTSYKPPSKSALVWSKLFDFDWMAFSSQNYQEKNGFPHTFQDLDHHHIIGYKWAAGHNHLEDNVSNILLHIGANNSEPRRPTLITDDPSVCCRLLQNSAGIGMLPPFYAIGTGLKCVLKEELEKMSTLKQTMYFVYPRNLMSNQRVAAFGTFIKSKAIGNL
jgi:DNA-binding transcriptional LysR family regulator